jgi:hypothetical protein
MEFRMPDVPVEVVALDLGVKCCGKCRGVEEGGASDAAAAGQEPLPEGCHVVAQRADDSHPRDDDSFACF